MSSTPTLPVPAPPPFHPSPAQRRLLNFLHEHPGYPTVHALCAAAGIGRTAYYRWCQDPGFRLWLSAGWSARLIVDGALLLNVARIQSTHSFPYWKALFDLTFDPKGLALLQHWQQAVAHADPAAFTPDPDPDPETTPPALPSTPPTGPHGVLPTTPSNQSLTAKNRTNAIPKPHHAAGCVQRALKPGTSPQSTRIRAESPGHAPHHTRY